MTPRGRNLASRMAEARRLLERVLSLTDPPEKTPRKIAEALARMEINVATALRYCEQVTLASGGAWPRSRAAAEPLVEVCKDCGHARQEHEDTCLGESWDEDEGCACKSFSPEDERIAR